MQLPLKYPLTLSFKILALAPQLTVRDANGNVIVYVRQKLLKLKESVTVFGDEAQTQPLFNINADRVIDWSAKYNFSEQSGKQIGAIQRKGMRSLWKARYDIIEGQTVDMHIEEENGWVKVMDGFFGEIPILGMLSGYLFHPVYLMNDTSGKMVMRMEKQSAFFEGVFLIEKHSEMDPEDEKVALLSYMMMLLLERRRG